MADNNSKNIFFARGWIESKFFRGWCVLVVIGVVLLLFCPSTYTKNIKGNIITPITASGEGFIGKSNDILDRLLQMANSRLNNSRGISNLSDLNKKYEGYLEFMTPEGPRADDIVKDDLRLVGICVDSLSEEERSFYYNSDLPKLLKKQKENLNEKLFKIRFNSTYGKVTNVGLISSMFRVPLSKDPWTGRIWSNRNSMFPKKDFIFISYGQSVIPISTKIVTGKPLHVTADLNNAIFKNGNEGIDYYRLVNEKQLSTKLSIRFRGNGLPNSDENQLQIEYDTTARVFVIKTTGSIFASVYYGDSKEKYINPTQSSALGDTITNISNGTKIVVSYSEINNSKRKVAEFTITDANPLNLLSGFISTNKGTERFFIDSQYTDLFTQQILHGLESNISNSEYKEDVRLTIDAILSKELEKDLKQYLNQVKTSIANKEGKVKNETWDISITILDMATGNVLATPFYSEYSERLDSKIRLTRKNPALVRRFIGSTFKPLLTLAAVETNNSLLRLDTRGKYSWNGNDSIRAVFFGCPTPGWAPEFWNGCNMREFISTSDDVYPVALAALCLNGYGANEDLSTIKDIRSNIGKSSSIFKDLNLKNGRINLWHEKDANHPSMIDFKFIKNINALYDVRDFNDNELWDDPEDVMSNYFWENLWKNNKNSDNVEHFGIDVVSPDPTVMRYQNMIGHGDSTTSLHGNIKPWVLGQGDNEWNCIKLAEAYNRMLTKLPIKASFVLPDKPSGFDTSLIGKLYTIGNRSMSKSVINNTWNDFLDILADAQRYDLLKDIYARVDRLNNSLNLADPLVLFSKTGTPNNYERKEIPYVDGSTLVIDCGTYCMGLMTKSSFRNIKSSEKPNDVKGIVCVLRISRLIKCKEYKKKTKTITYMDGTKRVLGDGLWSTEAKEFFDDKRLKKIYTMTEKSFYPEKFKDDDDFDWFDFFKPSNNSGSAVSRDQEHPAAQENSNTHGDNSTQETHPAQGVQDNDSETTDSEPGFWDGVVNWFTGLFSSEGATDDAIAESESETNAQISQPAVEINPMYKGKKDVVYYGVQIKANLELDTKGFPDFWKEYKIRFYYDDRGSGSNFRYRYVLGVWDNEKQAKTFLERIKGTYKDAFVVKIKNGKVI